MARGALTNGLQVIGALIAAAFVLRSRRPWDVQRARRLSAILRGC
jgi:hypothetical protein